MRVFKCLGVALVAVSGISSYGAAGQTQTPDGAQRFLLQVMPGMEYRPSGFGDDQPWLWGKITVVKTVDQCTTTWDAEFPSSQVGDKTYDAFTTTGATNTKPGWKTWGDVVEVIVKGNIIHINYIGAAHAALIRTNSEALAARTAYAIQFLEKDCDRTRGTGF
jgi:hypothetical protein